MTTWDDLPLSDEHAAYLAASAISPDVAAAIGVRTAVTVDQLPPSLAYHGEAALPALVFPWREPSGTVRHQIKPVAPITNAKGQQAKYLFGQDDHAQLVVGREVTDASAVLIVEGSKQVMAAATYAPPEVGVYGVLGCRGWSKDGVPTPDLYVVEDKPVYICLDGDVSSNLDVYNAAVALADACRMQGASSVSFIRLAAGKKAGLDDVLGANTPARRAQMLVRLIENAHKKPADQKPKPKKAVSRGLAALGEATDRNTLAVNGDRYLVINDLTRAMVDRWDGRELFNYGNAISRVKGPEVQPLQEGTFLDMVAATAITVNRSEDAEGNIKETAAWPDDKVMKAVASRAEAFTLLRSIQCAPFVRLDGSICTAPGYDTDSQTLLILDEGLEGLDIPEKPTGPEVAAAVTFLLKEWLGDFPLPTEADRANVLALILTPLIRGLADVVPVAVINGLQMGVGKNKLANCISIIATGKAATPLGYNTDNEEQRKVMTSVFRTGQTLFVWDECHKLTGEHFARAVTSHTYSDRLLGGSVMAEWPNVATWMTLGNNVQVENDMVRRVYEIGMRTARPNPQDRKSSEFRHPDIEGWTAEQRPAILSALLTLVRAWHVAGRPGPEGGTSFGSFEKWEKVVGGILRTAKVPGFLGNMREFRSDSDFDRAMWQLHLEGLAGFFGPREFTTREVQGWLANNDAAEAPPGFLEHAAPGFARTLGMAYQRQRDRWYGQVRLMRAEGTGHGKVAKWKIMHDDSDLGGPEGPEGAISIRMAEITMSTNVDDTTNVFSAHVGVEGSPSSPQSLPLTGDPFADVVEPVPNELDRLLGGAFVPGGMAVKCWECDGERQPVPPSGIGYACPVCFPAMFTR